MPPPPPSRKPLLSHLPTIFLSLTLSLQIQTLSTQIPALHGSLLTNLYTTLLPPLCYLLHFLSLPIPLTTPLLILTVFLQATALPLIQFVVLLLTASTLHPPPPSHLLSSLTLLFNFLLPYCPPNICLTPLFPHTSSISLALIAIIHISTSAPLTSLLLNPPPHPRSPRSKRPTRRNPLLFLPRFARLPNLFLFFYLLFQSTSPLSKSIIKRIHPRPMPPNHVILAQERGPTGLISVVHRKDKYIMMTADFSVLGGRYICPGCAQDSIFAQFHVHEAVRLTGGGETQLGGRNGRALCIGLGIGIAAEGLSRAGCAVDAVELDDVVAKFATKYFGVRGIRLVVDDGVKYLERAEDATYDFVVHDVFTGGSVPVVLFSVGIWKEVKRVLKGDGVVAVNFVGGLEKDTAAAGAVALVYDRLKHVFGHVRMFSDEHESYTHNIVFFASGVEQGVRFRKPMERDFLESGVRQMALQDFEKYEVKRESLGGKLDDVEGSDWKLHLGQWNISMHHMKLMQELHTKELWPALYAHEQLS